MNEKTAKVELHKRYGAAEKLLRRPDEVEIFLQRLEKKLGSIPAIGDALASVPMLSYRWSEIT